MMLMLIFQIPAMSAIAELILARVIISTQLKQYTLLRIISADINIKCQGDMGYVVIYLEYRIA